MPSREEFLNKYTNKAEDFEIDMRVLYTLSDNKELQDIKVAKLLSALVKHLYNKKLINDKEIDDLLINTVH
jgi:hypothetical protein